MARTRTPGGRKPKQSEGIGGLPGPTQDLDLRFATGNRCRCRDDVELYYEVRGEGPVTLTLVNHLFLVAPAWRTLTSELEQRCRLVSYDLRNQGASTRLPGPIRWSDHVEDLREVLDWLGVERTYLLGTSMSGMIVRDFALRYPERVAGVLFVGPAFSPYGAERRWAMTKTWLFQLERGGVEALFAHLYALCFSDYSIQSGGTAMYLAFREVFLAVHSQEQIAVNLAAAQSVDDEPEKLSQLQCRSLLMIGDTDFLWSTSSMAEAARLLRTPHVVTLPRAGHLPYLEFTAEFERETQRFIDTCEQEGEGHAHVPSPLEGEGQGGGDGRSARADRVALQARTPHPDPPPQGGRESH
jgi:3-oxoadipate enol-lactonase